MIKSVTVTNYLGDSVVLELRKPEASGFAITSISGLGPGKANVNTTELPTMDGGIYNSARRTIRNIVLAIAFMDKSSIEDARQLSYKYFPLKRKVKLRFETDNRTVEIEGYVESNEPTIFSEQEGTDISIVCPDPNFYSVDTMTTVFSGVDPMFEFPFSNESLASFEIEFGSIEKASDKVVYYDGDVETGVTMIIHALAEATNVTLYNTGTREFMRIDTDKLVKFTGSGIKEGDSIVVCTIPGRKSITLVRDGNSTNILNCLDRNSNWFQLVKGDNVFAYTAETGGNNLQFSIECNIVYEGI